MRFHFKVNLLNSDERIGHIFTPKMGEMGTFRVVFDPIHTYPYYVTAFRPLFDAPSPYPVVSFCLPSLLWRYVLVCSFPRPTFKKLAAYPARNLSFIENVGIDAKMGLKTAFEYRHRIQCEVSNTRHKDVDVDIHQEKLVLGWSTFSSIQVQNVLNISKCGMFLEVHFVFGFSYKNTQSWFHRNVLNPST